MQEKVLPEAASVLSHHLTRLFQRRYRGGIVAYPAFGFWGGYHPPYGYYNPYPVYYTNAGEVKLATNIKDADVYINGAYAGKAAKAENHVAASRCL